MFLYNLTLQRPTGVVCAVHGNFSGGKTQEIALARGGRVIELVRPDPATGKVHTLLTVEVFGEIRSMVAFRLTGGSKDYIAVGSDSGRIVILEYLPNKNVFEKVHQETFGKSGCRRIVPGQYMAADPKGRAIMISAVEKQKLVYILNRDSQARLTISSPLEAHKSYTFVYHTVGVDVGYENPMFAVLEMDYEEVDNDSSGSAVANAQQNLTFYELDLGLNHVVRKYSEPLEEHGNFLISVPGGNDGPSGVIICSENYVTYKNFGDQPDIRCPIPRRRNDLDDPDRGIIFVSSATHKTKSMFFFLVQTEQGDLFKITLSLEGDLVIEMKLKYFDTIPVATSLIVLKTGFLFAASEFGNHGLYQIAHLGEDDGEQAFSSSMTLEEGDTFYYVPRGLKNLILIDELDSLAPLVSATVADIANEDTPQLIMACGRGPRSSLRLLRHGLEVSEMAVSELPGQPTAVWTVKKRLSDEFDSYIIVSFPNVTLVLSIGDTVEEVTDSGFIGTSTTLAAGQIGDDSLVQIYPEGIRHIRADKRVNEWRTPGKRLISKCAINQRQVVIALSSCELVYFEMDPTGQLNEYTDRKEMPAEIICMTMGNVPVGEQRSRFMAVGLADETVRMVSLDPQNCLDSLSMQALPTRPSSLCIISMGGGREERDAERLYLNIGLINGVLLRTVLDQVNGDLSDTRTRYLGTKPVKLFPVRMASSEAVIAVSSRSWLSYYYHNRFHLTPLSYETLESASGFASLQCPEGVVAIAGNTLRILALEKLGALFNSQSFPLDHTPRRFAIIPESGALITIETDHNSYTSKAKLARKKKLADEIIDSLKDSDDIEPERVNEIAQAFLNEPINEREFGGPKAGPGQWASIIRLIDPLTGTTMQKIELEQNESVTAISLVRFSTHGDVPYVVVAAAKDLILNPRRITCALLYTYRVLDEGRRLDLAHVTPIEEAAHAMCPFGGRLAIGVGKCLRIYELGKKKLLRKCENKNIPNRIVTISSMGARLFVGDIQESIFYVKYKRDDNSLVTFADDTTPRWVTCQCVLDYDSIVVGDKFGNVLVLRLPPNTNDELDEDPTGVKSLWDRGWLGGASQKTQTISSFHIGDTVTSLQRTTLIPGLSECVIYTTLSGSIGVLIPFASHEDHEFFQNLEMHLRSENSPLAGRDHLAYRSAYFPAKHVIDGDLCEQFTCLDLTKQRSIASELDRRPAEVAKKLEDIRTQYAF